MVAVRGEIDISNAPQLRACLSACLSDGCADITLDMKDLTFLDASGLSVLAYFAKLTASRGGHLILKSPPPIVHKVLNIGGLATLVDGKSPDATAELPRAAPSGANGSQPPGER
jgi:anti-sigma B factor antagonist